jgi:ABC-2 type transport system ATP-binding protein
MIGVAALDCPESMIHVDRLIKHYGQVKAVDGISFDVRKGEIVGVLGPNGAGKSTTLRIPVTSQPAAARRRWPGST